MSKSAFAFAASFALATVAAAPAGAQLLPEELRFQGELRNCPQQPDSTREACERLVRAKIVAAWKARIEAESLRRVGK